MQSCTLDKPMEQYDWSEGEPDTENHYVMMVKVGRKVSMKTANSTVKASYYCNQKYTTLEADTVITVEKGSYKIINSLRY